MSNEKRAGRATTKRRQEANFHHLHIRRVCVCACYLCVSIGACRDPPTAWMGFVHLAHALSRMSLGDTHCPPGGQEKGRGKRKQIMERTHDRHGINSRVCRSGLGPLGALDLVRPALLQSTPCLERVLGTLQESLPAAQMPVARQIARPPHGMQRCAPHPRRDTGTMHRPAQTPRAATLTGTRTTHQALDGFWWPWTAWQPDGTCESLVSTSMVVRWAGCSCAEASSFCWNRVENIF